MKMLTDVEQRAHFQAVMSFRSHTSPWIDNSLTIWSLTSESSLRPVNTQPSWLIWACLFHPICGRALNECCRLGIGRAVPSLVTRDVPLRDVTHWKKQGNSKSARPGGASLSSCAWVAEVWNRSVKASLNHMASVRPAWDQKTLSQKQHKSLTSAILCQLKYFMAAIAC